MFARSRDMHFSLYMDLNRDQYPWASTGVPYFCTVRFMCTNYLLRVVIIGLYTCQPVIIGLYTCRRYRWSVHQYLGQLGLIG